MGVGLNRTPKFRRAIFGQLKVECLERQKPAPGVIPFDLTGAVGIDNPSRIDTGKQSFVCARCFAWQAIAWERGHSIVNPSPPLPFVLTAGKFLHRRVDLLLEVGPHASEHPRHRGLFAGRRLQQNTIDIDLSQHRHTVSCDSGPTFSQRLEQRDFPAAIGGGCDLAEREPTRVVGAGNVVAGGRGLRGGPRRPRSDARAVGVSVVVVAVVVAVVVVVVVVAGVVVVVVVAGVSVEAIVVVVVANRI